MLKKLILVENGKDFQSNSIEEIVRALIDDEYYSLPDEVKKEKMKIKARANTLTHDMDIVEKIKGNDFDNKFIIKDEITYILSLLTLNKVLLLERTDANIFVNVQNDNETEGNYIIVNKYAKDLLKTYLNK